MQMHFSLKTPLVIVSALILAACGSPSPTVQPAGPDKAQEVATRSLAAVDRLLATSKHAVVADAGHAGGPALAVQLAAKEAYGVQAVQHRWSVADIQEYRVYLYEWRTDNNGNRGLYYVLSSNVKPTEDDATAPIAAFKSLAHNTDYRVVVEPWGSNPTAPNASVLQRMNWREYVHSEFSFREDANFDIQNTATKVLTINLDPRPFSGFADVDVTVKDGQFTPPSSRPVLVTPPPTTP